ncbi:hypothetical protein ALI144C_19675 [Actinosynnema sp. ALI-1.44]|uniref:COG1470 family protein n=1 Tax=Actinosynnema sp. ALI-1.44 TaxID=1933779 RepID=UPI00097CABB0|nr:hypothetical protein [Actinosynnema sp. ALI-1.44]ONI81536.1 hypothetical protein ALI144C_19675 [Actinosynnema sp. ALI-1.44]
MTVLVTLDDTPTTVTPGVVANRALVVHNTGTLVAQYTLEVLGDGKNWISVTPPSVNLLPGGQATAQVKLAPPRSWEVSAGPVPFAVRVRDRDTDLSVVEEGTIEVEPFVELVAELVPTQRRARRHGRYRLAVDNSGNTTTVVAVHAADPDDALELTARPDVVRTTPGTTTIVGIDAAPRRRFLRGATKTLPFQVLLTTDTEEPISTDGVFLQDQLMPASLLKAAALLVVAVGALIACWYLLLKPKVSSVATDQVLPQAQTQQSQPSTTTTPAPSTAGQPTGNPPPPPAAKQQQSTTQTTVSTTTSAPSTTTTTTPAPLRFRIPTSTGSGKEASFSFAGPPGSRLDLGDMILQNPMGDSGLLRISIGDDVVLETELSTFRDREVHYTYPLRVEDGVPVVVTIGCRTPGTGATGCTPAVSFSGQRTNG